MMNLIRSIQERDPANPTAAEVFFAYNGFHAILWHRMSNWLWHAGLRTLPRIFANFSRILTGIEIHPGADIGQNLFIDHGTGVVIGQTALIGDNVTIYHGVTLGGVGREGQNGRRHPTIEDGVMIGSCAQILGGITIGKDAKIGSNSVVLVDIPAGKTALGIPAKIVGGDDKRRAYGLPSLSEMANSDFSI